MVIDSASVRNAGDAKFVSVGRTHLGGRKRLRMGLCRKRTRQKRETNEREKKGTAFHLGLDASSVARDGKTTGQ